LFFYKNIIIECNEKVSCVPNKQYENVDPIASETACSSTSNSSNKTHLEIFYMLEVGFGK
jgi:hypothetical protein